jgi:hypothetical protein
MFFVIAVGVSNGPDKFSPVITKCMAVSETLYTNVGTQVLDKDGKPISCTIPTATAIDKK